MAPSFSHLLLIFVVALVVLGPKKMPQLVAQVGRWAGKARAMARQFREQLENEINLEELTKTPPAKPAPRPPEPAGYADTMPWHEPLPDSAAVVPPEGATPASDTVAPAAETPAPVAEGGLPGEPFPSGHEAAPEASAAPPSVPAPDPAPLHHEHTIHAPPAPEILSPSPIIETHERGA